MSLIQLLGVGFAEVKGDLLIQKFRHAAEPLGELTNLDNPTGAGVTKITRER